MQPPAPQLLLVEDDPALLRALEKVFSSHFVVKSAATPDEALAAFADTPPAVIVTDFNLTQLTGFQLARNFRDFGHSGPIVLLTAVMDHPDIARGLAEGVLTRVFRKPCSLVELLKELKKLTGSDR